MKLPPTEMEILALMLNFECPDCVGSSSGDIEPANRPTSLGFRKMAWPQNMDLGYHGTWMVSFMYSLG